MSSVVLWAQDGVVAEWHKDNTYTVRDVRKPGSSRYRSEKGAVAAAKRKAAAVRKAPVPTAQIHFKHLNLVLFNQSFASVSEAKAYCLRMARIYPTTEYAYGEQTPGRYRFEPYDDGEVTA